MLETLGIEYANNLYIDYAPITILGQNLKAKNNYNMKQHECVSWKKEKLVLTVCKVLQFFWKKVVGLVKDGCQKHKCIEQKQKYIFQNRGRDREKNKQKLIHQKIGKHIKSTGM